MRLTGIDLLTDGANLLSLNLAGVKSDERYLLKAWGGLDADEIVRQFSGFSQNSPDRFYNYRIQKREIVLRIVFNPNFHIRETSADLRDELYAMIAANRSGLLDIHFNSGGGSVARLYGYVTKIEAAHFSKTPEALMTIRCDDGLFRGVVPNVVDTDSLATVNPIVISDNESTAPHGFFMTVAFTANADSFVIAEDSINPAWTFEVTPVLPFEVGDTLSFSSEFGARRLMTNKLGDEIQLMDRITPGSIWPLIYRGNNELYFSEIGNFDWIELAYFTAYWGV